MPSRRTSKPLTPEQMQAEIEEFNKDKSKLKEDLVSAYDHGYKRFLVYKDAGNGLFEAWVMSVRDYMVKFDKAVMANQRRIKRRVGKKKGCGN